MSIPVNSMEKILHFLQSCEELKSFSFSELEELIAISRLIYFEKGRDVFSIEHQDKYLFVVGEGILSLRLHHNRLSKKFMEGALFGEITLFSDRGRLGAIHCLEEVCLVAIDKNGILQPNSMVSDATRFKFLRIMGKKMAGYFYQDQDKSTEELILEKESEYLEFKASTASDNWPGMIRTIASFMNLNGGTILCGVKDGGGEQAYFITDKHKVDQFERDFRDKIHTYLGENLPAIYFDLKQIGKTNVVRIDVNPSSFPIFYRRETQDSRIREVFYIRTGCKNHPIRMTSDIVNYIQRRFKIKNT